MSKQEIALALLRELGCDPTEDNVELVKDVINGAIDNYWLAHYVEPPINICTLCGNTGIVDTTGARSPDGSVEVGKKQFCVCPNGQNLRKQGYDPEHCYQSPRNQ